MCTRTILLAALLLVGPQVWAQDATKGRLPDGRAYRVGEDGYRLVDQIAELQVTNDDLRRQVAALETDLDAKEILLKNCGGVAVSKSSGSTDDPPNCNELVSTLYLRVSRLQQQLDQKPGSLPPATNVACDYKSPKNPLWAQVHQLKTQVDERDALLGKLQGEQDDALRTIRAKQEKSIAQMRSQLTCDYTSEKNPLWSRVHELEGKLKEQSTVVAKQSEQIAVLKKRSDELATSARGRLSAPREKVRVVKRSAPKTGDVELAKREFEQSLAEIQTLIFKRKSLYDNLKKGGRAVSINVQRLETRGRVSLDSLRRQVARLNTSADAARVRQGLKEIRQILQNDIAVLKRLSKR